MDAPLIQRPVHDGTLSHAPSTDTKTSSVFTHGTQQNRTSRKVSMPSRHRPATLPFKVNGYKSKSTAPKTNSTLVSTNTYRKRRADDPTHCLKKRQKTSTTSAAIIPDVESDPLIISPTATPIPIPRLVKPVPRKDVNLKYIPPPIYAQSSSVDLYPSSASSADPLDVELFGDSLDTEPSVPICPHLSAPVPISDHHINSSPSSSHAETPATSKSRRRKSAAPPSSTSDEFKCNFGLHRRLIEVRIDRPIAARTLVVRTRETLEGGLRGPLLPLPPSPLTRPSITSESLVNSQKTHQIMLDASAALWAPYFPLTSTSLVHTSKIPCRTLAPSSHPTSSSSLPTYEEDNHFSSITCVGRQGGWNSVDEEDMYEVDIPPFDPKA